MTDAKFLIYLSRNMITGEYYIGAHKTRKENDGYLGSGLRLRRSVKKYGKENFTRQTLLECVNESDMFDSEEHIIEEYINDPLCLNIQPGGKGGWNHVNSTDLNKGDNNIMRRNQEVKDKVILHMMNTKNKNKEFYDSIAITNLEKASEKNKGRVKSKDELKKLSDGIKDWWKNNRENILKGPQFQPKYRYELTSPEGICYTTTQLKKFVSEHNLTFSPLWNSISTGEKVKGGKSKGWICKKFKI